MKNRWYLPVIILLYVLLAGVYSFCVPLFEAPDEVWHYGYVYWVAGGNGLPAPDRGDGLAIWAQEGSQPPLYYLAAGLLTRPLTGDLAAGDWGRSVRYNPHAAVGEADSFGNRNHLVHGAWDRWPWQGIALAAHAVRLFSILLGVVTVVFTYLIGRCLAPRAELPAVLAAALVAFNPQFLFLSASVSNDNLITATCAVGVWLCLRIAGTRMRLPLRWPILLGVVVGVAALAKLSGLLLLGLALVALAIAGWRLRSWRSWLGGSALVLLVAAVVAGWWYWRNWRLMGDPLGLAGMFAVLPAREMPLDAAGLLALAPGVWRSAWAVFGWFNVTVDEWVYWVYSLLVAVGCAGWILVAWRQNWGPGGHKVRRKSARREEEICFPPDLVPLRGRARVDWVAVGLLAGWSAAVALALVRWAQINYPQGRLLFPAIAAAMPLVAVGLLAWWPPAWRRWVAGAISLGMAVLAAAVPFVWILPAYAAPPVLAAGAGGAGVPNRRPHAVGDHVQLVGYSYAPEELAPGGEFDITLYWRSDAPLAEDYSVFVHLVDELGIVQAQSDSYPAQGAGRQVTGSPARSSWTNTVCACPRPCRRRAACASKPACTGMQTVERLPTAQGDSVALGSVDTVALTSPTGIPNPMRAVFGDKIALTGYSLDRRSLKPGESFQLDLWWEGLTRMAQDYKVFIHLMLPPDAVWAQQDRQPQDGAARTSTWEPGQVVRDQYTLTVPPDAPPGIYDVAVGLYDKDTYDRLQIKQRRSTDHTCARARGAMMTTAPSTQSSPKPGQSHKIAGAIRRYVPLIETLRTYDRGWLRGDLAAGATVFAVLVPSALAYGELAGLDPVAGIYAAIGAMLGYALFGTSRQAMLGPDASLPLMVVAAVAPLAAGDPLRYVALAATTALLAGAICIVAGFSAAGVYRQLCVAADPDGLYGGCGLSRDRRAAGAAVWVQSPGGHVLSAGAGGDAPLAGDALADADHRHRIGRTAVLAQAAPAAAAEPAAADGGGYRDFHRV